jgi:hypothetical protein
MLNDLGHKVNFDEARLLLASADTSGDNKLTLDEFLVLVYSDKQDFNVDPKQLSELRPG